ncbi:MAG TPA: co-chaperone DjlA [Cellvibrionaceae bacterium]
MGKLLGGIIGFMVGGPLLALLGVFIGHMFDRGRALNDAMASPEMRERISNSFFETTFTLLGYLAKADGRVSEVEVAQTEQVMAQMGLSGEQRQKAIELFKTGSAADFDPAATLESFRAICGRNRNLVQMLLTYLVNLALADGHFDQAEERVLREVAAGLGISSMAFDHLLRMIKAQNAFASGGYQQSAGGGAQGPVGSLSQAYEALGVSETSNDTEIKRAYRKLMSQYHPDKLAGQGLPENAVKEATERSQEIQAAYDLIKKSRQG